MIGDKYKIARYCNEDISNIEKAYEKLKNNLDYTYKCNGIIDVKKVVRR